MKETLIHKVIRKFYSIYYRFRVLVMEPVRNSLHVIQIRYQSRPVNVAFFAMSLSLWRYQRVFEIMQKNPGFHPFIVLTPGASFSPEQQKQDLSQLQKYFKKRDIPYIDWDFTKNAPSMPLSGKLKPGIIFYTQPYYDSLPASVSYENMRQSLFCYCQYGMGPYDEPWAYNQTFYDIAWRLFYARQRDLEAAKRFALNRGRNVIVTGYTNIDVYLDPEKPTDVWKQDNDGKKRLIWAPHFTINSRKGLYKHSNFLWMAHIMIILAQQYAENLQIAFKPHPLLLSELYKHPAWGKEKTDAYYQKWATMHNTQLETGDYLDLFRSSDAMIHDCSSFLVEYLYLNKPVMFVAPNVDEVCTSFAPFGRNSLKQHYVAVTADDIKDFISNVVLGGKDTMRDSREEFFGKELQPADPSTSVAQAIVDEIASSLHLP